MWNESNSSETDQYQDAPPAVANPIAWTDGQLIRLESEWRQAQRAFAYHPHVGITALRGDPPTEYQVDYKVNTLLMNEAGELEYADAVSMHVWMPPGFPNQPPLVRPMAPVFHPNIAYEGVYFSSPWQSSDSLVEFLRRVGEYLAYRAYDPEAVVNEPAYQWLEANSGILPLDGRADFSATAGGEPLGRISRFGAATLDQIRQAIDQMRKNLVAEGKAPSGPEVKGFADHTRAALSVFLEGDIPDHLRQAASEFDDWTRELPASAPSWEYLRRQRAAIKAVHFAVAVVQDTLPLLTRAMEDLEKVFSGPLPATPNEAARRLPATSILQTHQLKLPTLVRNAEQRAQTVQARVAALTVAAPSAEGIRAESSLGRRLKTQLEELNQAVLEAQQVAATSLAEFRPILGRARAEAQALERIIAWRGYVDIYAKGLSLERELKQWGPAGIQAFFLDSDAGRFGPFQYEEPLELGTTRVAVRNLLEKKIEVFDADSLASLGRSENGRVTIRLKLPDSDDSYAQNLELTERCDDALVQLNFIVDQTAQSLARLQSEEGVTAASRSWCGQLLALLSEPSAQSGLRREHRRTSHRWKRCVTDLSALSRFKERVATYHLLNRAAGAAPQLLSALEEQHRQWKESSQRTAEIAARCGRDVETDRLIIPPKYAKPYADEVQLREKTQREIQRLDRLLKTLGEWVKERVGSQRLSGRPETPALDVLPAAPEALAEMSDAMSDNWLRETVAALEKRLGISLPIKLQPAPVHAAVARPLNPAAAAGAPMAAAVHIGDADRSDVPMAIPVTVGADGAGHPSEADALSQNERPVDHAVTEEVVAEPDGDYFIDSTQEAAADETDDDLVLDTDPHVEE